MYIIICLVQFSSVAQSYLTLCDPMDYRAPGFSVHHQLPEPAKLMSIESVMPSNNLILCHLLLLLPSIFPSIRVFSNESVRCIRWPKYWSFSFSIVLLMTIQDWSPLGWTGLISLQSQGLSRVFSNTTVQKHQFFTSQPLYGPALPSIHDYWKNHGSDYMDLCWQNDVSAF